jgi:hypothetical protein
VLSGFPTWRRKTRRESDVGKGQEETRRNGSLLLARSPTVTRCVSFGGRLTPKVLPGTQRGKRAVILGSNFANSARPYGLGTLRFSPGPHKRTLPVGFCQEVSAHDFGHRGGVRERVACSKRAVGSPHPPGQRARPPASHSACRIGRSGKCLRWPGVFSGAFPGYNAASTLRGSR